MLSDVVVCGRGLCLPPNQKPSLMPMSVQNHIGNISSHSKDSFKDTLSSFLGLSWCLPHVLKKEFNFCDNQFKGIHRCLFMTTCVLLKHYIFHYFTFFQIKRRFIINLPAFRVRVVDKDGIHELPTIKPQLSIASVPSESL